MSSQNLRPYPLNSLCTRQIYKGKFGIFELSATAGQALANALHTTVEIHGPDAEYKPVINDLLKSVPVVYVPIGNLPWVEIDFPQDVERVQYRIFPRIAEE